MDNLADPDKCSYCNEKLDSDDFLNCDKCTSNVHTKCLKRPGTPGDLHGDVFFVFTCINCNPADKREIFIRRKLPWLMIIILTIYNLSILSKGLSHHGFFHWRNHIANFIEKNWNFLFPVTVQRKKKWIGTISGILSHHSPDFFTSGHVEFQESGWWKLTYNQTPKFYMKLYEQIVSTRQQLRNSKRNDDNHFHDDNVPSTSGYLSNKRRKTDEENEIFSRTLPYMGRNPKCFKKQLRINEPSTSQQAKLEMNSIQSNLREFLEESLTENNLLFGGAETNTEADKVLSFLNTNENNTIRDGDENNDDAMNDLWNLDLSHLDYEEEKITNKFIHDPASLLHGNHEDDNSQEPERNDLITNCEENDDVNDCKARIIQVTNFQQVIKDEQQNFEDSENNFNDDDDNQEESENEIIYPKSLFTKTPKRELPWKEEENEETNEIGDHEEEEIETELMSEYEEKSLHLQLKKIFDCEKQLNVKIPSSIRRFYRKLCIRNIQRKNFQPIFNLDAFTNKQSSSISNKVNIIDRYYETNGDSACYARLSGPLQHEFFESPYTSRILHPFIYRHSKLFPPWLKIMCELQYTFTGNYPSRSTIDFCYVRPNHIPAINALLQSLFWPGIDMSECLSYPDFSVVVLYKKLVIGCGFLVPDVGHNEAYISFMAVRPGWQRSGIATFMLYHLSQTCMGKDITLHVSATNPAVCLYQKFGFKIKEVILDFYEKYLPIDSKHSRHALFLRLSR